MLDKKEVQVLDKGFVKLIDSMGNDLKVANSARISLNKIKEVFELEDEKLINFLIRERHTSPLEHIFFTFHVKMPLFVARQQYKHRIGSYVEDSWNEISGRYSVISEDFYVPSVETVRTQIGKPGAYSFGPLENKADAEFFRVNLINHCKKSVDIYRNALSLGVAKEQARMALNQNFYTEFYWTCNLHSFIHYVSLRVSRHAQEEIRDFATPMLEMVKDICPITIDAAINNNWIQKD